MMKKLNKSWGFALATLLVAVPTLGACTNGPESGDKERRTLRIGMMYGSKESESYYRQQMTDMFEVDHGNIDIEFVYGTDYSSMQFATDEERKKQQQQDPQENLRAVMSGDNPVDVVMTDIVSMKKMASDNLLKPLDDYIKQDKMDLSDFLPAVMDTIKAQGDGRIYGLSPTFSSNAVFYNKKLFANAKVEPPRDGMTWNELFAVAQSMKSGKDKDAVYGFAFNNYGGGLSMYDAQSTVASFSQMRMFDTTGEKMTVHTKTWADAWTRPIQLYKDRVIPHAEDMQQTASMASSDGSYAYNPYQGNGFIGGKIAMVVGGYYMVNELINYNKNVSKMKNAQALEWDVVSMPQLESGGSNGVYLSNLASINAKSANPDDAWAFIKHMNSEEVAKFKARSQGELSVRQKYIQPKDGANYRIEAFTNVKVNTDDLGEADQALYRERPNLNLISELGGYLFQEAAEGKKTVDEALAEWDSKGNELLQKIKLNPTGDLSSELQTYRDAAQSGMKNMLRAAAGEAVAIEQ
ncbi:ABC transporter substrate-binding protein [Cohnella sp. GCM10020058]|uniref:ABC transporter substrate-binding protein n=1 Tax=Cohnella sp. GCM10020058 TaxID=3317330 RepID=UPI00363DC8D9